MKIGAMELVVILLVAFLVLGPDKTVLYVRKMGRGLRTLKIYVDSFTDDIRENVTEPLNELQKPLQDLQEPFKDLSKPLNDVAQTLQQPMAELDASLTDTHRVLTGRERANAPGTAAATAAAAQAGAEPPAAEPEEAEILEEAELLETPEPAAPAEAPERKPES